MTTQRAWWETPRRSFVRACAWLVVFAWWLAALASAVYRRSAVDGNGDCHPPTWARVLAVVLGCTGAGLASAALLAGDGRRASRLAAMAVVALALWLAFALLVAPSLTPVCVW